MTIDTASTMTDINVSCPLRLESSALVRAGLTLRTPSAPPLPPSFPGLQPSLLTITKTPTPSTLSDGPLLFGASFSDHMLTIKHVPGKGWQAPEIKPFANLELHPASAVFHYAPCLFEGTCFLSRQERQQ